MMVVRTAVLVGMQLLLNLFSVVIFFSAELQQWAGELEQLQALATESCERLLSEHVPTPNAISSNRDAGLRDVLKLILEQCGGLSKDNSQIHIQVPQIQLNIL